MSGVLIQFVGSLVAILALAGIAWWLKLGPPPELSGEADAVEAASQVDIGFEPERIALDRNGAGALLSDADGRIMILRPHGTHLAGRILGQSARARLTDEGMLAVCSGERRFAECLLDIDDPTAWMQAIAANGMVAPCLISRLSITPCPVSWRSS